MGIDLSIPGCYIFKAIDSICLILSLFGILAYLAFIRWLDHIYPRE